MDIESSKQVIEMICYIHYMISNDPDRSDQIFREIYDRLQSSSLLQKLSDVKIVTVGNHKSLKTNFGEYEKAQQVDHKENVFEYEFPTLSRVYQDAQLLDGDTPILYLHLKGASKPKNHSDDSWRERMMVGVLDKHVECLESLQNIRVVGIDLARVKMNDGETCPAYTGNFWWSSARHLSSLPDPSVESIKKSHGHLVKSRTSKNPSSPRGDNHRYLAEFWVCMNNLDNPAGLSVLSV